MFMQISIVQWIFLVWILLLVLKSVVALFDKDAPDEILFGVLLILGGALWILQHFGFAFYVPWFIWLKSFRYEILIAILLILYGVRLVFQAPWKHILVILVAILAFVAVSRITFPNQDFRNANTSSLLNSTTNSINEQKTHLGEAEDQQLDLIFNRGNFTIKTDDIDSAIVITENEQIENKGRHTYQLNSKDSEGQLLISNKITDIDLDSKLGNLNGIFHNLIENMNAKSNLGDIQLSFYKPVERSSFESNMGNMTLDFHQGVEQIYIKANAGNVNIYLPKGYQIDAKGLESRLGNLNISNGDGTQGKVKISGVVNLGNINIISDL
jgi:hypothetical protein